MKIPKIIKDGFKNIMKGLGGSRDPRSQTTFVPGVEINQALADSMYSYNWLCSKVVDVPVDDATRKWRNILISDPKKKEEIEEIYTALDIKGKFNLAMKWARVFGGAAIIIVIEGDDLAQPLDITKIRKGSLKNLLVLDRWNIYPGQANRNILSDNFGKPETYTVAREGQAIHHTRVVKFFGMVPTIHQAERNNFWGLSLYTKLWEPISQSQEISNSIASAIYESNLDVYRINGLNDMIAEGSDDLVIARLKIAHEMKGVVNGIALDKEDEYEKKSNRFTDLPNIDDRGIQKVAGASKIPVTKLLGISPSGLGATGDSENRDYYDDVQAIQENEIRPRLDYIDQVVMASSFGVDVIFKYEFNPLQQVTESQQAEIDAKNATRDQIYFDMDILTESDVLAQLAEDGTYISIDETRAKEADDEDDLLKDDH